MLPSDALDVAYCSLRVTSMRDNKDRIRRMLRKQKANIIEESRDSIKFVPDLNKGICPPIRLRFMENHLMFITEVMSDIPESNRAWVSGFVHDFNKRHSEGVLDYDEEDGDVWVRTWQHVNREREFGPRDLEYHIRLSRDIANSSFKSIMNACKIDGNDAPDRDREFGPSPVDMMYSRIPEEPPASESDICKGGGIPLGFRDGNPVFDGSSRHTVLIGSTGVGKTICMVVPFLVSIIRSHESFAVYDPKGELEGILAKELEISGHRVCRLDGRRTRLSDCVGMLTNIFDMYHSEDEDERNSVDRLLDDIGRTLIDTGRSEDRYWVKLAVDLFIGCSQLLLRRCSREEFTLDNVYALKTVFENNDTISKMLLDDMPVNLPERKNLSGILVNSDVTRRCILSFFDGGLSPYIANPGISSILSYDDFNLSDAGFQPMAVFIRTPDETSAYDGLVSLYFKTAYTEMVRRAHTEAEGRLPVRMNFVLEELANLPVIPDLDRMLSISRSRNIRFLLVLQSKKQLESRYGPAAMDIMMNNCGNVVYMANRDPGLLKEICEMTQDRRITPKALRSMPPGRALIINGDCDPYFVDLPTWEAYDVAMGETGERAPKTRVTRGGFDAEEFIIDLIGTFDYKPDVIPEPKEDFQEILRIVERRRRAETSDAAGGGD